MFGLTEWIFGNDLLGVDGLRDAEPVFSTHPEAVLFARSQFGHSKAGFGAGCGDGDPVALADITFLHYVVGDVAATIFLWGVPEQCAGIDVLFSDLQRSFRGSRDVCWNTESLVLFVVYFASFIILVQNQATLKAPAVKN